jgi:hypothetical protein
MGGQSGEKVSAAAVRTMSGGARVTLSCRISIPDLSSEASLSGVVDFETDRCRLDGQIRAGEESDTQSLVLDGSGSYNRLPDGRWTFTSGELGTRGMFHPSGLLEALVHAQTSAVVSPTGSIEVGLDHDELDRRADAGLAHDWNSTAVVELSPSGRVASVVLSHRSEEDSTTGWIEIAWAISEPDQAGAIDLPPPAKTISMAKYIDANS